MALTLGILEGDDIGLEVVPECVKVMKEAAAKVGLLQSPDIRAPRKRPCKI